MFDTIIVGADSGPGGRDAVALARVLGGDTASVVAVRVVPTPLRGVDLGHDLTSADRQLAQLAGADGTLARATVVGASVGAGLRREAAARGADLVVVGSSHRGPLGRLVAGDDARDALHHAGCPVAIAPRGYADGPRRLRTVGVGYDGTAAAEDAVAVASDVARDRGAAVRALAVVVAPVRTTTAGVTGPIALEDEVRNAYASLDGLPGVEPEVAVGATVSELERFAERVDVLVVGGAGDRVRLGEVADALLRRIAVPLLVVPPVPATAREVAR